MVVIFINIVLTLVELAVEGEMVQLSLQIINYFFVAFYVGETVIKVSLWAHTALHTHHITAHYDHVLKARELKCHVPSHIYSSVLWTDLILILHSFVLSCNPSTISYYPLLPSSHLHPL